jgi:predicted PurR-regulated permease PerM
VTIVNGDLFQEESSMDAVSDVVADTSEQQVVGAKPIDVAPIWIAPMARRIIWQVIWIGLGMTIVVLCLLKARGLVSTLVVAFFFGIAMDPAVTMLNVRRKWKRGTATAAVFFGVVASVVVLIAVLIPAIASVSSRLSSRLPGWISSAEKTFHIHILSGSASSDASAALKDSINAWVSSHASQVLGLASSSFGLVFQFFTIAMFTFYFAADAPRIRRAVLQRMSPERQARLGWAWDVAIQQTGGYFYSRLLLMIVNGLLFFAVMVVVGVPWLIALPLSVFQGFVSEFIPAVGTYLGAGIPILITLGLQGAVPAIVLLAWTLIYQQVENYWLAPKISAKTMEINGGVAFAAALAGGAIAGPMGAFMALPMAAMVTSFVKHFVVRYPLAYRSAYDADLPDPAADSGPAALSSEDADRPTVAQSAG